MRQLKNSTKCKRYKHFTEKERYKLEALLEQKIKIREISKHLGKHRTTIHREISKGKIVRLTPHWEEHEAYRADVAQRRYEERVSNRERNLKIANDHKLAEFITKKIKEDKYSPEAAFIDLWEKPGRKKKRSKRRCVALRNRTGKHISERPIEAEERTEYGHWEIDCIKSGKNKSRASLLTLTERTTREEIIRKMPDTTGKAVDKVFTSLEGKYKGGFKYKFKSMTADNGSEFLDWETLEASKLFKGEKRTKIYFANPYSSWEHG